MAVAIGDGHSDGGDDGRDGDGDSGDDGCLDGMARVRGRRGSWGRSLTSAEAPMAAAEEASHKTAIAVQRAERVVFPS